MRLCERELAVDRGIAADSVKTRPPRGRGNTFVVRANRRRDVSLGQRRITQGIVNLGTQERVGSLASLEIALAGKIVTAEPKQRGRGILTRHGERRRMLDRRLESR